MLAYVFIHQPRQGVDAVQYQSQLRTFHAAVAGAAPVGFYRSWTWQSEAGPLGAAYEDWYLVAQWAALEALNEAAVTGLSAVPHDAIASGSGRGVGAIYRLASGVPSSANRVRIRVSKPRGVAYAVFESALSAIVAGEACIWKRQMVLGPDAEFLVDATALPDGDVVCGARVSVSVLRPVW